MKPKNRNDAGNKDPSKKNIIAKEEACCTCHLIRILISFLGQRSLRLNKQARMVDSFIFGLNRSSLKWKMCHSRGNQVYAHKYILDALLVEEKK